MSLYYSRDMEGTIMPIDTPSDDWVWDIENRRIKQTYIADGVIRISTVFLVIDHAWSTGIPVLWETIVFGGPLDQEQRRYTSEKDAISGHDEMVACVREALEAKREYSEEG